MDVADLLRLLGLERHQAAFREHEITADVLTNLSADDLKELGITAVGHRRRLPDLSRCCAQATSLPTSRALEHPRIPDSRLRNVGRSA